jgi:flagellar motor switch protein FliN
MLFIPFLIIDLVVSSVLMAMGMMMLSPLVISLQDLMSIGPQSVIALDALAGEPLVIKVNGAPIGRAEVVVAGEQYGLKVIDLDGLNLDALTS